MRFEGRDYVSAFLLTTQINERWYNGPHMEKQWEIKTVADLKPLVSSILDTLTKNRSNGEAIVLALHGELGAGKTTFMQILAKELGVVETVTSPTFVVMKNYSLEESVWERLVHIDAYRIEDTDEMRPLGFVELLQEPKNLICIEWAEKIADLLPPSTLHLHFTITGETRKVTING